MGRGAHIEAVEDENPMLSSRSVRQVNLCDLHGQVLGELWPAEMVVCGTRVCKAIRAYLRMYSESIHLTAMKKVSNEADWQFTALGGLEPGVRVCQYKIRDDLKRFESARGLRIDADSCKIQLAPMLSGLNLAHQEGWNACLYALHLSCRSESPENITQLERILQPGVLGKHSELQSLDLSGNRLDTVCKQFLPNAILGFSCLQKLNLSGCRMGGAGFSLLAPTLERCRALTHLDLARNYIDQDGVASIGGILRDCPLVHLDLSESKIGFNEVTVLARDLCFATNLTHLNMAENYVASESGAILARALAACTRLTTLDLHKNTIGCEGITELALQLRSCTALTQLDLQRNCARAPAAGHLLRHLDTWCGLKELNLGWNETGLTDREATAALAGALEGSTSLTRLHLCRNFLRDPGVRPIVAAMGRARCLSHVLLAFNDIGAQGAAYLAHALGSCDALRRLDLQGNKLGDAGMRALAGSLHRCAGLEHLNVACNGIGEEGATLLAAAIADCGALREVDVRDNRVGRRGAERLELLRGSVVVMVDEEWRGWRWEWPLGLQRLLQPSLPPLTS